MNDIYAKNDILYMVHTYDSDKDMYFLSGYTKDCKKRICGMTPDELSANLRHVVNMKEEATKEYDRRMAVASEVTPQWH